MEISVDSDAGDLIQDVDDGVGIAVRDTAGFSQITWWKNTANPCKY